jgi:hypothetical protein
MKHLLKIAIGAAIAAALVNMMMKRRSATTLDDARDDDVADTEGRDTLGRGTGAGYTVEELIADTPAGRTLNS